MWVIQICGAFGVRAFGTALVAFLILQVSVLIRSSLRSLLQCRVDYQSGPERPHFKGFADLIYAQASFIFAALVYAGSYLPSRNLYEFPHIQRRVWEGVW